MKNKVYIGTYSLRGSKGIYLAEADDETGALEILDAYPAPSPSYLAISGGYLFAALECAYFEGTKGGGAASYSISSDGVLIFLSAKPTGGKSPCHVCPWPEGKKLFVSNYGDGTLSIFSADNGMLSLESLIAHTGCGPDETRQKGPHVHCCRTEGGRLWAVDLGIDKALIYNLDGMSAAGCFAVEGGCGPRHIVFSGYAPYAWIVCELSNEVYALNYRTGERIGVYSTLPAGFALQSGFASQSGFAEQSFAAAIKLSPDERRLYVSNRGHDSIACFKIDAGTGSLSLLSIFPSGGRNPRDIAISPNGAFLYAANQDSDTICVFALEDGLLKETGLALGIPAPVCVLT